MLFPYIRIVRANSDPKSFVGVIFLKETMMLPPCFIGCKIDGDPVISLI